MQYRLATDSDLDLLAEWNHQLIADEGHRNAMSVSELRKRVMTWLAGEYQAVVFEVNRHPVAYALYREDAQEVYLRQLFVDRTHRRRGIGRQAMSILRTRIWPASKRLTVEVLAANMPALAFWRSVGYREYSIALEIMPEAIDECAYTSDILWNGAESASERQWETAFADSREALARLADEALAERRAGRTQELDPDTL